MIQAQWRAFEEFYHAGLTRAIGVSNFCPACLECLAAASNTTPAVNQLQFHAGVGSADPRGLLSYNTKRGIVVQAYSPLGGEQAGGRELVAAAHAVGVHGVEDHLAGAELLVLGCQYDQFYEAELPGSPTLPLGLSARGRVFCPETLQLGKREAEQKAVVAKAAAPAAHILFADKSTSVSDLFTLIASLM